MDPPTLGAFFRGAYVPNQMVLSVAGKLDHRVKSHGQTDSVDLYRLLASGDRLPLVVKFDQLGPFYLVGAKRGDTERTASGLHVAFDRIFGTALELKWSASEIEIDDERSGESLGLSRADQRSLDRQGEVYNLDLRYDWKINEQHRLAPTIGWVDRDLDGAAMAEDGLAFALKYLYEKNRWLFVSQVFYEDLESDARNPIYDRKGSVDSLGAVFTAFYTRPFGLEHWTANATVGYQDHDSNIDFYDSNFGLVSFGMLYRFD